MKFVEAKLPKLDLTRIAADEARGIRFSGDKRTLISYNGELTDEGYTIPNGVTEIGEYAFSKCGNLTTVTIPDGVTEIGAAAFIFCAGLLKIAIPDSVTTIGEWAFLGCLKLMTVNIPESVTEIGPCAFAGCPCGERPEIKRILELRTKIQEEE